MLKMHGENVQKLFKALFCQRMQCQEMDKTTRKRIFSYTTLQINNLEQYPQFLRTGNFDIRFCTEHSISARK